MVLVGGGAFVVPGALVVAGLLVRGIVEPPPPPLQVVVTTGAALAQAQTALAEARTPPILAAPQPAITQGPADA